MLILFYVSDITSTFSFVTEIDEGDDWNGTEFCHFCWEIK